MLLANSVPADAYFGLVLMAVVLIGGIVMTALVILRNRKASPPPDAGQGDGNHPELGSG